MAETEAQGQEGGMACYVISVPGFSGTPSVDLPFTDQESPARAAGRITLCCSKWQYILLALGKQRAADSPPGA